MSWRSIVISNPAQLFLTNNQLIIKQDENVSIPLEDIGVVILEEQKITLTTKLLDRMADFGILVFVCDEKHIPKSIFTPFLQHSRQLKVLEMQLNLSKVFTKRCWKEIVIKKIMNQAECMRLLENNLVAQQLEAIALEVQSGDTTNREAFAAQVYFKNYIKGFKRRENNSVNYALNYGYSIIRGAIARSIVSYGFIPSIGIHHRNELNNLNLADDFIEPFRPLIDLWVATNISLKSEFTKEHRIHIIQLLHNDILLEGEKMSVLNGIDRMIASFSTACIKKDYLALKIPNLIKLQAHIYE